MNLVGQQKNTYAIGQFCRPDPLITYNIMKNKKGVAGKRKKNTDLVHHDLCPQIVHTVSPTSHAGNPSPQRDVKLRFHNAGRSNLHS